MAAGRPLTAILDLFPEGAGGRPIWARKNMLGSESSLASFFFWRCAVILSDQEPYN
jgi:hypothetical protein